MLYEILVLDPLLGISTVSITQLRLKILKKTISYFINEKNNKAPGPDGIPIEFYKTLFCNEELLETHPAAGKCLKLIFNKIWNGSFPLKKWN